MGLDGLTPAPPPAGVFSRLVAFAFDLPPAMAVAAATAVGLTWRLELAPDGWLPYSGQVGGWALAAGAGFVLLYHVLLEGVWGATPGKLLMGIGVQTVGYAPCGPGRAIMRTLSWPADTVGWIGIAVSDRRQRWGDRLAGTLVVEQAARPGVAGWAAAAAIGWTLVLFVAAAFVAKAERTNLRVIQAGMGSQSRPGNPVASSFQPGERVWLTFGVAGFRDDGPEGAELEIGVRSWAAGDVRLATPWRKRLSTRRKPNQQMKVELSMLLEDLLPLGPARFEVKLRDKLQDKEVTRVLPFRLEEPAPAPAGELTVGGVQASDLPGGPYPAVPHIRQARRLFFRLKVFGVAFRDDRMDLQTDCLLLRGDGSTVSAQRSCLVHRGAFPGRPANFYAPLSGMVQIGRDVKPGPYRLRLTLRDEFGGRQASSEVAFQVIPM